MTRRRTNLWGLFMALPALAMLWCGTAAFAEETGRVDWKRVARLRPDLKVLVQVKSKEPISLKDLALLSDRGLQPADRDPGLVLGLSTAVFQTKMEKWREGNWLPPHMEGKLLERFYMSGIYRVAFKVKADGYVGPLTIEVTAPRDGFGRRLGYSAYVVRPECESKMRTDSAGNRWLSAQFQEVRAEQTIRFHFGFDYEVDVAELLKHDLLLADAPVGNEIPTEVSGFLKPGYKIDPRMPAALSWAASGGAGPVDARKEWKRLTKFIEKSVTYDQAKRAAYFGGKMVYADLDMMYQEISETLAGGKGCCPDTVLLECAFLRARGIPCLTAGRFGHFFSIVYLAGRGWMSTSVTPTEIPLLLSPGPDHVPYQRWTPRIPLKTTLWEARVRIDMMEE
ncbi:MAG: hypothetical protein RDU20_14170 [Desulfomonilaceae bacterium]|nr:hypothetical protein [Desulfomonilaceae bacterium]